MNIPTLSGTDFGFTPIASPNLFSSKIEEYNIDEIITLFVGGTNYPVLEFAKKSEIKDEELDEEDDDEDLDDDDDDEEWDDDEELDEDWEDEFDLDEEEWDDEDLIDDDLFADDDDDEDWEDEDEDLFVEKIF